MHIIRVIVGRVTPLLFILGMISVYTNNQVNVTTYAQPVLRSAIEANGSSLFRNWSMIEDERIRIRYHSGAKEEVEMIFAQARTIQRTLDERYQFRYSKPLNIVIMPSREEMRKVFKWEADASAVGVYYGNRLYLLTPSLWIKADSIEDLAQQYMNKGPIAHEYMHFIMDHKYHNNLPRWYNEGVAQYEEYIYQGYEWMEDRGTLDQELYSYVEISNRFDQLENQPLAYRQAFAFVRYQIDQYGEERYWEFMNELEKRTPFERAFAKAYSIELVNVWDLYEQYIEEKQIK